MNTAEITAALNESIDYHADHYASRLIEDLPADWREKTIEWVQRYEIDETQFFWRAGTADTCRGALDEGVWAAIHALGYTRPNPQLWTGHEAEMSSLKTQGYAR